MDDIFKFKIRKRFNKSFLMVGIISVLFIGGIWYGVDIGFIGDSFDDPSVVLPIDANSEDNDSLFYSSYLGGSLLDYAIDIAVDSSGYIYITGYTNSSNFPITEDAYSDSYNGGNFDAFMTKINPDGSLNYSTYLGGNSEDRAHGIVVGSDGSIYVTGSTRSTNFPTTSNAINEDFNGGTDVFISKFNPDGTLAYSSFFGGSLFDEAWAIAVDSTDAIYITGRTESSNFTTSNAYNDTFGGVSDAFLTKINSDGTLAFSTYIGGNARDHSNDIAIDGSDSIYIVGYTYSENFPTTSNAYDSTFNGVNDVFISKFNSDGTLAYSSFLGGTSDDRAFALAVNSVGAMFITGRTRSTSFPTTDDAISQSFGGSNDAFVTKLNSDGTMAYSTYIGGSKADYGQSISVDSFGNAYILGNTASADFPTSEEFVSSLNGWEDIFVCKLNIDGSLNYSTYYGGSRTDSASGIAVDNDGVVYFTGYTNSLNFPTTEYAINSTISGSIDSIIARINPISPPDLDVGDNGSPNVVPRNIWGLINLPVIIGVSVLVWAAVAFILMKKKD